LVRDPAEQWELWGRVDPYYGVLSSESLRSGADERARRRFFQSGEDHLASVEALLRRADAPPARGGAALDFGCGVGRVLVPLARRFERVVGIDVSRSMLAECARNVSALLPEACVELLGSAELGRVAPRSLDLVHSSLVFQHIPTGQGEVYLGELAERLAPGGVGVIHLTTRARSPVGRAYFSALKWVPCAAGVANVARGRRWSYPHMQMNRYRVDRAARVLDRHGCDLRRVEPVRATGIMGFDGAMLVFAARE
jgi:SAM-dependent methyltransferase